MAPAPSETDGAMGPRASWPPHVGGLGGGKKRARSKGEDGDAEAKQSKPSAKAKATAKAQANKGFNPLLQFLEVRKDGGSSQRSVSPTPSSIVSARPPPSLSSLSASTRPGDFEQSDGTEPPEDGKKGVDSEGALSERAYKMFTECGEMSPADILQIVETIDVDEDKQEEHSHGSRDRSTISINRSEGCLFLFLISSGGATKPHQHFINISSTFHQIAFFFFANVSWFSRFLFHQIFIKRSSTLSIVSFCDCWSFFWLTI